MSDEDTMTLLRQNHTEVMNVMRGISLQITILFARIGAVEDEMSKLVKRMDSIELAALGRRQ